MLTTKSFWIIWKIIYIFCILYRKEHSMFRIEYSTQYASRPLGPSYVEHFEFSFCNWQISYASTSVVLSDRSVYKTFVRTVPSDELLPAALASTMNYYGWKRLAIVTEDDQQNKEVSNCSSLHASAASLISTNHCQQLFQAIQANLSRHSINISSRSTDNVTFTVRTAHWKWNIV